MRLKKLPNSKDRKNLTIRLDDNIKSGIRDRAGKLGMSQSYYIAALVWLDDNGKLIEQLGDPFDVSEDLSVAKLTDKIAEMQAELDRISSQTNPLPSEPTQPQQPVPGKPAPVMPPMRTIADLVQLNAQGGSISNPPVNQATVDLRDKLIEQQKADQKEREDRRQMLNEVKE